MSDVLAEEPAAGADDDWQRWEFRLGPDGLISYRYLGCSSVIVDPHQAEGRMRLRRDMRGPAGLLVAPLGIALLDTAGINIDPVATVAPTRIDIDVFEEAEDVDTLRVVGRVVRQARSQMFTEGRFEDANQPGRVVGFGSTSWAVVGPQEPGYHYVDPAPGVPETPGMPSLPEAFGAERRPGGELFIGGLSPLVGPQSLHQGPIQVLLEAAAAGAVTAAAGSDALRVEHSGVTIVRRGTVGPFIATAEVIATSGPMVAALAELYDEGKDCLVASGFTRWRRL